MSQTEESEWRRKNSCIFYRLMVDSIIQDKKLQIPRKFTRKYGDQLSSVAILETSDGRIWMVDLEKQNRNIYLSYGWHKFIEYYSIQPGFFLLFKHEGKSKFSVHIFNLAACEVKFPRKALSDSKKLNLGQSVNEANEDNQNKVLCCCPGCPASELYKKEDKPHNCASREEISSSKCSVKKQPECDSDVHWSKFCSSDLCVVPIASGQVTKRMRRIRELAAVHCSGVEDQYEKAAVPVKTRRVGDCTNLISRKERVVTPEQQARTLEIASSYKPENPQNLCCTMVLRASYVYKGYLSFPRWFARMYLEGVSGFITLICGQKQWLVRCVCTDGTARLSMGWPVFVEENNLLDGDICVLDVTDTKRIIIKVTVFRVLEAAGTVDNDSTMNELNENETTAVTP